ncbi:uncharacterized protein LOC114293732, partial [Camellia sinensis]|uniref:uncharacterized protein LOC114293732 n=1 Tax=Camellia sinensis TaxID=4442 RepID=UPI001035AF56
MSTTQGNFASARGITTVKNEPDHLLVLVHGILASPSDWIYVEAELKRRLGRNFLIYASSCNSYTKTFAGIDGAGKRLADEIPWATALNSASALLLATTFCFLLRHVTRFPPTKEQYPVLIS